MKPKVYIKVIAEHHPEAGTKPLSIEWIDGRKYEIDRVLDKRKSPWGIRYTCRIMGRESFLFEEDQGKWFVEAKV